MQLLAKWITNVLVLLITAYLVPGFSISSYVTAFLVVIVIAVLNTLIKPILIIFTLPINILTLGLFTFIINAIILELASLFVKGFVIESFGTAIIASIIMTAVSFVVNSFIG